MYICINVDNVYKYIGLMINVQASTIHHLQQYTGNIDKMARLIELNNIIDELNLIDLQKIYVFY